MPLPKNYFQFRLRTLLVVTALVAITAGFLRSEFVGRIQTEADADLAYFRTGLSPAVFFTCRTPEDARHLSEIFNRDQFLATAIDHLRIKTPDAAHALRDASLVTGIDNHIFFVKYDFSRWGRYRLDLPRFRYIHDLNDPVAEARNAAVYESFTAAGEAAGRQYPLIQTCKNQR